MAMAIFQIADDDDDGRHFETWRKRTHTYPWWRRTHLHAHTHTRTQRRRSRRCSKSSNVVPKCHYRHLNDVLLVFVFPTDQQQQQRHKMDACVRARLCVREYVFVSVCALRVCVCFVSAHLHFTNILAH